MQRKSMPRSCYTILHYLEAVPGQQTHKDLVAATGLAPRTVRYAVHRLKEEGLILERFNFRDSRQSLYSLNSTVSPAVQSVRI